MAYHVSLPTLVTKATNCILKATNCTTATISQTRVQSLDESEGRLNLESPHQFPETPASVVNMDSETCSPATSGNLKMRTTEEDQRKGACGPLYSQNTSVDQSQPAQLWVVDNWNCSSISKAESIL